MNGFVELPYFIEDNSYYFERNIRLRFFLKQTWNFREELGLFVCMSNTLYEQDFKLQIILASEGRPLSGLIA